MIRKQDGFTLVELMITMVVFVIVIVAAANIFSALVGQFKQQSRIAETNVGGTIGLQMLKSDIEQAGYGLPWDLNGASYIEANNDPNTPFDDTFFNDSPTTAPTAVVVGYPGYQRVVNGNPITFQNSLNNSNALAIKATSVATNSTGHLWTYITNAAGTNTLGPIWKYYGGQILSGDTNAGDPTIATEDLALGNYVIVMQPDSNYSGNVRGLVVDGGGNFYTQFNTDLTVFNSQFQPPTALTSEYETYLIYGVDPNSGGYNLRMPFNRADYYIRNPGPPNMPLQCAPGTGILYKAIVNQRDGNHTEYPLLDCVADMQVVLGLDVNGDGIIGTYYDGTTFANAPADISNPENVVSVAPIQAILNDPGKLRSHLKEVRVYILTQDGGLDMNYTYTNNDQNASCQGAQQVWVGDDSFANTGTSILGGNYGTCFNLQNYIGANYMHYRWRVYQMTITPYNLD